MPACPGRPAARAGAPYRRAHCAMSLNFDPQWFSRYPAQDPVGNAELSCVFCGIASGEVEAHVIAETADTLCFLDHLPATYGHVLVVPKPHFQDLLDISE